MRVILVAFLVAGTVLSGSVLGEDEKPLLVIPEGSSPEKIPLVVALHEYAAEPADVAEEMRSLAEAGGFALLCPRAAEDRFTDADLPVVLAAINRTKARIDVGTVHVLGRKDAGLAAIRYALSRPRVFRSVVAEGADVPDLRPASGADRLRLLLLKGAGDRAEAGRRSVLAVREDLEVAEFRLLAGEGRDIDPATLTYVAHFIEAASGRIVAGRDGSFNWQEPARGLALRNARKVPALVYLFDGGSAYRSRTELIQGELFFDQALREAMSGVIPILAPRSAAEEVVPGQRLAPGPALVVLDREGKSAGALQKNLTARAISALLAR